MFDYKKKVVKRASLVATTVALTLGLTPVQAIEIVPTLTAEDLANALILPNTGLTVTSAELLGGASLDEYGGFFDEYGGFFDEYGGYGGEGPIPPEFLDGILVDEDGFPVDDFFFDGYGGPAVPSGPEGFFGLMGDLEAGVSQAGTYTNNSGTYGLPGPGIVLSSGNVMDYEDGPNLDEGNSTDFGTIATLDQSELLSPITGESVHYDPVQLNITFDVDDDVDTVSFIAVFGSEEWPEFQESEFTDGFGMFLNGQNVAGAQETGAIPGDPLLPINIDHPDMTDVPGTELDGILAPNSIPLLRFDVPVQPGSTGNIFEIIIADSSDNILDTTVYFSSFGNFDSDSGISEFTPILPDPNNPPDPETGTFVFDLPEVDPFEVLWIDPDVSTGYVYEATGGGLFASVVAPSLLSVNDPDGYTLTYQDAMDNTIVVSLLPGETYVFTDPVATFTLEGIDENLMLDPLDPMAFVTGISFSTSGQFGATQTPITTFVNVPEPRTLSLFAVSVLALLRIQRRT